MGVKRFRKEELFKNFGKIEFGLEMG